jgi:hypothetical protein
MGISVSREKAMNTPLVSAGKMTMTIPEGKGGVLAAIGAIMLSFFAIGLIGGLFADHAAIIRVATITWYCIGIAVIVRFITWNRAGAPNGRSYWWAAFGPFLFGLATPLGLVLLVLTILMARSARRRARDSYQPI